MKTSTLESSSFLVTDCSAVNRNGVDGNQQKPATARIGWWRTLAPLSQLTDMLVSENVIGLPGHSKGTPGTAWRAMVSCAAPSDVKQMRRGRAVSLSAVARKGAFGGHLRRNFGAHHPLVFAAVVVP